MDIREFIAARLADDQKIAEEASALETGWPFWIDVDDQAEYEAADRFRESLGPARVLRDVEATRRILELHKLNVQRIVTSPYDPFTGLRRDGDYEVQCFVCGWVTDDPTSGCETLRLLALPFAAHPDYRTEWTP